MKPVAVVDIGKTHAKLLVVDAADGRLLHGCERASQPMAGASGLQLDLVGIESWLRDALAALPMRGQLQAIVPVAHGAAAVWLDARGQVLAAPDYDDPGFEAVAEAYRPLRDDFQHSFSPFLPRGLNLGRQFYWISRHAPGLLDRCASILTYPQYWAWRFSGVAACELTSLGCHSDLWLPLAGRPSDLAVRQGWAGRLAPLQPASAVLGAVSSDWQLHCGINAGCRVICGIHDSNASYLAQMLDQPPGRPFATVSSGTWTVIVARGTDLARLVESEDMLANIDATGQVVATARFAGGVEYGVISGRRDDVAGTGEDAAGTSDDAAGTGDVAALRRVLRAGALALPSFADTGGPYAGYVGRLIRAEGLDPAARVALAALYLALMTDLLLEKLGVRGDVLVDGPLSGNELYLRSLATLRPAHAVRRCGGRNGIVRAALHLAGYDVAAATAETVQPLEATAVLSEYRQLWRARLPVGH